MDSLQGPNQYLSLPMDLLLLHALYAVLLILIVSNLKLKEELYNVQTLEYGIHAQGNLSKNQFNLKDCRLIVPILSLNKTRFPLPLFMGCHQRPTSI